jgi:hypothetical protein
MDQVEANMDFNRKTLAEDTLVREQQHAAYEVAVGEFNQSIAAVDEAIALLSTLTNTPSLLQSKKLHKSFSRVHINSWNAVKNGPMVKALVDLAISQNFSDQSILQKIVVLLGEFRNDIVDALNLLSLQESENQAEYEERVA